MSTRVTHTAMSFFGYFKNDTCTHYIVAFCITILLKKYANWYCNAIVNYNLALLLYVLVKESQYILL
jgi:hypothetical protein